MATAGGSNDLHMAIGSSSLITETKIVPVDQYSSVYNPKFNKVEDESFNLE